MIFGKDNAAFEFHGWGELAAFYAPSIGYDCKLFNLLYVGEVGVHVVDDSLELGYYFGMAEDFGGGGEGYFMFVAPSFEGVDSGGDNSGDELLVVADYHGLFDEEALFESIFDGRGRDVFAVGGFEEFFFAVCDLEELYAFAIFHDFADIAGDKPAVGGKYFGGFVFFFVVAFHDVAAFDEDFAFFGGVIACAAIYFDLDAREERPDGA